MLQNFVDSSLSGDEISSLLKKFPYRNLCSSLKPSKGKDVFECLQALPLKRYPFAWTYILGAVARLLKDIDNPVLLTGFVEHAAQLLQTPGLPDVNSCTEAYSDVLKLWVDVYRKQETADTTALIPVMRQCIETMQCGDKHLLTPAHQVLLYCCWEERTFDKCVDILDEIHTTIAKGCKTMDVLLYFFYAGSIFLALERPKEAVDALYVVLCSPQSGECMSAISVDAHKRYKLASLIAYGKVIGLPRFANQSQKNYLMEYVEIEDAFTKCLESDISAFDKIVEKNSDHYMSDWNLSLVRQVRNAIYKHRIFALEKVYTAIGLEKLAKKINLPPARSKELILLMINSSELNAELGPDGIVTLKAEGKVKGTVDIQRKIEVMTKAMLITERRLGLQDRVIQSNVKRESMAGMAGPM